MILKMAGSEVRTVSSADQNWSEAHLLTLFKALSHNSFYNLVQASVDFLSDKHRG